jgi:hypothetical protein
MHKELKQKKSDLIEESLSKGYSPNDIKRNLSMSIYNSTDFKI